MRQAAYVFLFKSSTSGLLFFYMLLSLLSTPSQFQLFSSVNQRMLSKHAVNQRMLFFSKRTDKKKKRLLDMKNLTTFMSGPFNMHTVPVVLGEYPELRVKKIPSK